MFNLGQIWIHRNKIKEVETLYQWPFWLGLTPITAFHSVWYKSHLHFNQPVSLALLFYSNIYFIYSLLLSYVSFQFENIFTRCVFRDSGKREKESEKKCDENNEKQNYDWSMVLIADRHTNKKKSTQNRWPIKIEKFKTRWQNEYKIKRAPPTDNTDRMPQNNIAIQTKILSPTFNWHFILVLCCNWRKNKSYNKANCRTESGEREKKSVWQNVTEATHQRDAWHLFHWQQQTKFIRNIDRYTCAIFFFLFTLFTQWKRIKQKKNHWSTEKLI